MFHISIHVFQRPIGLLTTSSGEPVDLRDIIQLNSDQFTSQYQLDLMTKFDAERVPERVVHAKGTGSLGYLIVTNDVSKYTSADLFNGIGKKTPLVARFSTAIQSLGGSDLARELKGLSIKFYTKEGNLDLTCLQTPVYLYRDPTLFSPMVHAFKRNPRTYVNDPTRTWDFITLRPEIIHTFFWTQSDYGLPNGYRKMDAFPIHTYELSNKHGERHYVRFNFRTEQGLDNLTVADAIRIQGTDLDFFNRDLYNAIESKNYPSWRVEIDVMTIEDIKNLDYDPFDVTILWKNGTYKRVQIGRVILNQNPENVFRDIEQGAFNPGNLVPGIPGPIDVMFKGRRLFYLDSQNYRLGTNHNKINVNKPLYAKTYNRDGVPPVRENMDDAPNYYPNSFNGPLPFVDESRPKEKLLVLQRHAVDLSQTAYFYNNVLENDAQRQRLVNVLVTSLVPVREPIKSRSFKLLHLIDKDLGNRVEIGVKAAELAASAGQA